MINFDKLFAIGNSKVNTSVKLTASDRKSGVKILCQEDYAQELYDQMSSTSTFVQPNKDLEVGEIYSAKVKSINLKDNLVHAYDTKTFTSIFVPVREMLAQNISDIDAQILDSAKIKVIITRKEDGTFFASEKQCVALTYRQELDSNFSNSKYFNVTITDLIDGGYIAKYKNEIRCFLPGSQAAANVIHNFEEMLGKEIPVMIENFDASNNLYIVSYKKYIKNTIASRVSELRFGKKYSGKLTAKPLNFGVFVEWDNYFTGLIHHTEFGSAENYSKICNEFKAGDEIEVYVKDITFRKGSDPRIILTLDAKNINQDCLDWQNLKDLAENKVLDFTVDKENNSLEVILPDDTITSIRVDLHSLKSYLKKSSKIKVDKIDILRKDINFNFVTA